MHPLYQVQSETSWRNLGFYRITKPGVIDGKEVLAEVQVQACLVENFKPLLLFGNSFLYSNQAVIDFRNLTITLGSRENLVAPVRIRTAIDEVSEGVSKTWHAGIQGILKPLFSLVLKAQGYIGQI
jgi:hypothetical protein